MKSKLITFVNFLNPITEALSDEIAKLQADISMIDTQVSQRTQPLTQRKLQLQKLLAIKQKQLENQPPPPINQ